ncbi:hypothetical protein [Clostridium neonatale]|uniref:Uncharacterized protein n=1 Tax=Clostridium neonatale TaxID=137838 RepID=A0AA86JZY9_9CLOT|nr:hypothetical protein CNEO_44891 [Clostridium neonatale]
MNIAVVEDMKNDFDIISNFIDKYYKKSIYHIIYMVLNAKKSFVMNLKKISLT